MNLPVIKDPTDPFKQPEILTLDGQPVGSSIEYNVGIALKRLKIGYFYQYPVLGGRGHRGGTVIDFLVMTVPLPTPLYVQGGYWHGGGEKTEEDSWLMNQVRSALGNGASDPKEIWEQDCLTIDDAMSNLKRILGL